MKLRKLFVPGDFILVRDERSNGLLTALEIPSVQVQDIVFLHTPPLSLESNITTKRVGISVRGGFLEENEGAIAMIYDRLIELGYTPIFLVFSTAGTENQNDTLFIQKLMIGKTYNTTKTIEQTLEIYPSLYAVIGMRLHAGILACVQEIPYIPISYGPKTDELIDMLEYDHLAITAKDLTLELFESRWQALMADYDRERTRMRESHVFFRDTLTKKLDSI